MKDEQTTQTYNKNAATYIPEKAFFFLRHNNDIDHIVPVLYKWLEMENIPTDVILYTKRSFLDDYRIKYLKKYKNLRVLYIKDLYKLYDLTRIFNKTSFTINKANQIIKHIANKLFDGVHKGIVVFDWTTTDLANQIVRLAKQRGLTTISLPHGDSPYANLLETINDLNYNCLDPYKRSKIFDYVVVPNQLTAERYKNYIDENKLKILGSPRYCDEWMEIISQFTPQFDAEGSQNKLKIVFFLRNTGYPIFWDEVVRTIKLISQFPEIFLIIKHHPRNKKAKKLTKKLIDIFPNVKNNIDRNIKFIYDDVNSGSLLNWADLIIDVGTSVTWEAVKRGKPVLMLEYLYANYSTVASYMKTCEIKCRDELYRALKVFSENKNQKFYNETERRKFIREIIDVPDKYVLERYSNFMKMCLNESYKTR